MTSSPISIDFDRLLKLRLVVARHGEMDAAQWWNTGDATRRTAILGKAGAVLLSRGFPRTHLFAQARIVFEVARARCAEVFDPPGCVTLWKLPATIEDQFDSRWAQWLDDRASWTDFFASIVAPAEDLLATLTHFNLVGHEEIEIIPKLRRSAEGRAVPLPGVHHVTDQLLALLAAGFSRGEARRLAVPYARLEG